MPTHRTRCGTALAAAAVTAVLVLSAGAPARAQGGPGTADTTPPVKTDASASGLRLRPGAKLAPGRVLDIKSVVETDGGNERREDTNVDVTFALQAEVLFDKDSAHLGGAATDRIRVIAEEARKQHAAKLRIFGFTDNLGSADHGVALSKDRANAVQRQLAQDLGSSAVAYEIRGYGEDYPIADNATEDGRRKNRRVEVSFPRGKG
ncbi:outer membrane protein OmpA-like peptidoglycan-associated protein [Streptomyces olivoverticillatus]|uniref:Outer membrane protein OmpA-like peptidoglycan-associated protein n=1 Tax=Streptomyces olivoverticillatus TaxID=66427 RepID=A0A7W7LL26_9ACTN|nr:OmpA family protein [Streptomyces olivoverticillatus]MBB4891586.1 outer membrane protein OmpA-like peptidoglycan-associated protein [Streptomyces olivoverticillatus]